MRLLQRLLCRFFFGCFPSNATPWLTCVNCGAHGARFLGRERFKRPTRYIGLWLHCLALVLLPGCGANLDYDELLIVLAFTVITVTAGYWFGRVQGYRLGITALLKPGAVRYCDVRSVDHEAGRQAERADAVAYLRDNLPDANDHWDDEDFWREVIYQELQRGLHVGKYAPSKEPK